jgi:hypothetical protein
MAEALSDLPAAAVEHAVTMWSRGDKSHLKAHLREDASVGIFFPRPAQLRQIAEHYLSEQRELARQRKVAEEQESDLAVLMQERPQHFPSLQCPRCREPLTELSPRDMRFMADVIERRQWLKATSQ